MTKLRENKFRVWRIIQIDKEIRKGTYPSIKKFVKAFEVSERTIARDLEFLRDRYNAPLEYDREKNGYYYSDSGFAIQDVILTEADLFTLSTIMPLLEQYNNTPLESSFKNIVEKIFSILPETISVDSAFLNKDVSFIREATPAIDNKTFITVFKSIREKKEISFRYKSQSSDEYTKRRLQCFHVLSQKGNWYVIGHEPTKAGEVLNRTFSLARMKDIVLTTRSFALPNDFNANEFFDESFGIWSNPEPAEEYELVFDSKLETYITEREWHATQEIQILEDKKILLRFNSNQRQMILNWVLGFGANVKVIKPPHLCEKVKSEIHKMQTLYE